MGVAVLSPQQVAERALASLGLDGAGVDLFSTEALAAAVRRAASFSCPATPTTLVRIVMDALGGLPGYDEGIRAQLDLVIDALVGVGDLLELPSGEPDGPKRQIYLGYPAFVRRRSGAHVLIGVRPDGEPLATGKLAQLIEFDGHLRVVRPGSDLDQLMMVNDIAERSVSQWLQVPRPRSPVELLWEYTMRLDAAGPSGEIEGARILDPAASVRYYRGRWRAPKSGDSGMFVARRPQAYGADLWCAARFDDGRFVQLVDLPLFGSLVPAADEAWELQAAIDAERGHRQRVRLRPTSDVASKAIDFFSPLPSWAQRRLDLFGTPLLAGRGSLFTYSLPADEVSEELDFLADRLWMSTETEPERTGP